MVAWGPWNKPLLHGQHDRKPYCSGRHHRPRRSYAISTVRAKRVTAASVFGGHLVEERIAQAVGVGIPLARASIGSERRCPDSVGAIAPVHRKIKPVAEKQFRPL